MSRPTLDVYGETIKHDQTNMNVHVRKGARLIQHGQINGDVTVYSGGVFEQHGQVNGDVHAHGSVALWGKVNGEVHAYPGGDFLIAEGVMVGRDPKYYVASDGTFQPVPDGEFFMTQAGPTMWRLNPDGQLSKA